MKHFSQSSRYSEKGSALILILVAIVLFAALSYAVANMMRGGMSGGGASVSAEKAKLYAGEVLDYARVVRQVVQDLRISNGCSDTDISFEANGLTGYTHSPVASDDCKVFHPDGGGLNYVSPIDDINNGVDWMFSGANQIEAIGTDDMGSFNHDSLEIIAWLPYISLSICNAINEELGIGTPPPQDDGNADYVKFNGAYSASNEILDTGNVLEGRTAACFEGNNIFGGPTNGGYHFYQVLIAR